jgi:hypothetical protein
MGVLLFVAFLTLFFVNDVVASKATSFIQIGPGPDGLYQVWVVRQAAKVFPFRAAPAGSQTDVSSQVTHDESNALKPEADLTKLSDEELNYRIVVYAVLEFPDQVKQLKVAYSQMSAGEIVEGKLARGCAYRSTAEGLVPFVGIHARKLRHLEAIEAQNRFCHGEATKADLALIARGILERQWDEEFFANLRVR